MRQIAIKMLIGDRAKYIGIILGLAFATFIITQQMAIFIGLMARTYGFVTDTSQAQIWVMDPNVQYIDDIKPLRDTQLNLVKGVEGVEWATPLYKGLLKARLFTGEFQTCNVLGIDENTMIGQPPKILEGNIKFLRQDEAIIVNRVGAEDKLAKRSKSGGKIPLQIGDVLEINDRRARVVGICETTRTFQSQPVIYTTYNRALFYAPKERKMLSFILVGAKPGISPRELCKRISDATHLAAYTRKEFERLTVNYYLTETGIPINFGTAVILGFIIGIAVAGQTFYNFILDTIRFWGVFKAMGATDAVIMKLIFIQASFVGFIGWGLGVGLSALFGFFAYNTELSFHIPWQLLIISCLTMFLICYTSALFSMRRVFVLEPAIVFKA